MKTRIGMFFGGKSVEHEVSVISAAQAAAAMDSARYEVIPVYISKDNEMYTGPDMLIPGSYRDLPALLARSRRVGLYREGGKVFLRSYPKGLFGKSFSYELDLAFPVVHGTNCEDGSIQGFLQLYDLPYVGSDVGASASGMDKWTAKCLMRAAGLPVLPGYCLTSGSYYSDPEGSVAAIEAFHAYPLVIKPVNLGSSVGVSAAHDRDELVEGIELAASFAERLLIEPMLSPMREINCAVLGDIDQTEASACEEPVSANEILSYRDKYQRSGGGKTGAKILLDNSPGTGAASEGAEAYAGAGVKGMGGAMRILPAVLEKSMEDEIRQLARKAFTALNCAGVARVDFLIDTENGQIYVNELNTIPGSLSFYLWEAGGKSFGQLTDELVRLALKRHRAQAGLIWSNDANLLSGIPVGIKGAGK